MLRELIIREQIIREQMLRAKNSRTELEMYCDEKNHICDRQ